MKYTRLFLIFVVMTAVSCSALKKKISMNDVIKQKVQMDKVENPAQKLFMLRDLGNKRIIIENAVVKEITTSTNIDYDFCVILDVVTSEGKIECYVYTRNVKKVSRLIKGKTRINVVGEFGKFFTMLDEYYTKVEIIKSGIKIADPNKKK